MPIGPDYEARNLAAALYAATLLAVGAICGGLLTFLIRG